MQENESAAAPSENESDFQSSISLEPWRVERLWSDGKNANKYAIILTWYLSLCFDRLIHENSVYTVFTPFLTGYLDQYMLSKYPI